MRGKSKSKRLSEVAVQAIRDHINSFLRVLSYYCRSSSKREYLDENLNLRKMHDLYVKQCQDKGEQPLKFWKHDEEFNSEFNLAFHSPKKDQCDACTAYRMLMNPTDQEKQPHADHIIDRDQSRMEKERDRLNLQTDENTCLLCIDLQNFSSYRAAISVCFSTSEKLLSTI